MENNDIVCFAKDWGEDPTSCNHVMRGLARTSKVLWVNSIATRAPSLTSGRDLRKILAKLGEFVRGARQVEPNLWVLTPLVLPFHDRAWAVTVNQYILKASIAIARWRIGIRRFHLWTFVPTAAAYVGRLGEDAVVYYCTDDWTSFSFSNRLKASSMMEYLASHADIVFATSRPLVEKLKRFSSRVFLASHGVQHALFATALQSSTALPADLAALPRPVIGYYGLIEDWLDLELIVWLAKRHPEWSFALIGQARVDTSMLAACENVYLLGRKSHEALPSYCKGFDVALIPHKVNELTLHMNPIKLREYMSAGVPVVATALPEVAAYSACQTAETYEGFETAVLEALRRGAPSDRQRLSESMRGETWERKVVEIRLVIAEALADPGHRLSETTGV
jgi:glycosyltransferase involved in cell wall biosynthesis